MGRNVFENSQESHHFKHILFQIIMCKSVCPFSSHKLNTAGWFFFPHLPSSLQQIWSIVKVRSPFCFDIISLILVVPHSVPILAASEVRIKVEPAKEGNWDCSDRSDLRFCSAAQKTKLPENKPHRVQICAEGEQGGQWWTDQMGHKQWQMIWLSSKQTKLLQLTHRNQNHRIARVEMTS